jgi:CubicO group peptidase (beta-lactamase class C family)
MAYKKYVERTIKISIGVSVFLTLLLFEATFSYSVKSSKGRLKADYLPSNNNFITNTKSSLESFGKFDKAIQSFVRQWHLIGASVAVARDGKLLYAKGYGYANREEQVEAQPYDLYRVASVSKLITAVAVMKLTEENKLELDTRVFGPKGILNDPIYLNYKDKRVEDITVKNLLNHSGGWTSRWGDHMFINDVIAKELGKPMPVSLEDIVVFALSKNLHFPPGHHSSYSNLGYAILQLVIEKASGIPYETYVRSSIFDPLHIDDAFLAFNWDSLRYANEVRYYEVPEAEKVPAFDGSGQMVLKSRGGNDIRTLGAAGGWVISSLSLIKFLMAIDGEDNFPDIIARESVETLVRQEGHYQPLGWRWVMSNGKWWRSGSLPGTSALAVVQNDGFTYVFLTNTSPWKGAKFPYYVDRFMDRALRLVDEWPRYNLFELQPNTDFLVNRWDAVITDPFFSGKIAAPVDYLRPMG